jgi:hypothetical protein
MGGQTTQLSTVALVSPAGSADARAWSARVSVPEGVNEIEVKWGSVRRRYLVDRKWRRPYPGEVDLEDARHEHTTWPCSFTDAVFATPSVDAPAYRVEWAADEASFAIGLRHVMIVPRSKWDHFDSQRLPRPASIAIGHLSCAGWYGHLPKTTGSVFVGVTALFADGGETPAPRELIEVKLTEPVGKSFTRRNQIGPTPPALPGRIVNYAYYYSFEPEPDKRPFWEQLVHFVFLPFAAGYLAVAWFLRRRRARAA